MSRAVSIYWIHVYVSFLLDCRHLHLTFIKKAIFLNTLSDPWSSEYSNYDERAEGWEAIFSLEIICYLRLIFMIFCVCVCSRYLVSGGDPLHAGVWSPSLPGNQRQRDSGHDFGLSLLHSWTCVWRVQRVSKVLDYNQGPLRPDLQRKKWFYYSECFILDFSARGFCCSVDELKICWP